MLNVTDDAMGVLENARTRETGDDGRCIRLTVSPGNEKTFNFSFDTVRDGDSVIPGTDDRPLLLMDDGVALTLDAMELDFGGPDGQRSFVIRNQE